MIKHLVIFHISDNPIQPNFRSIILLCTLAVASSHLMVQDNILDKSLFIEILEVIFP